MKRLLILAAALALLAPAKASATWSIIAVDRTTGRVVIASATCAAQGMDELKLVQAIVVPGVAVAAAQAGVDRSHTNQKLIFEELQKKTDPAEIIRMLERDPNIESRQFGIVDLQGRHAGRSGSGNRDVKLDLHGPADDGRVVYSVQGNIIKTEEALRGAARIMKESRVDIVDRVMLAMEEADKNGGDSRCTCETQPLPGATCNGKTAHVAYILAADPANPLGRYAENHPQTPPPGVAVDPTARVCTGDTLQRCRAPWNDGQYALYIAVYPSNWKPEEDSNPVRTLRARYDAWKRTQRPGFN
jgi:hypothetical protein